MKKESKEKTAVGVATVTATLFYEKPKMKRIVSTRFGFCMESMTKEDKKSLATALTNMYKIHIEECFIRNEIPAADRIGYRCTFKTMECEMIINQSVESE